ncbi:MAG: VanZ family protein [Proteobacteria bacterium]|nr:VanZ family protein [Pseudomonadota bacterium]
MERAYIYRLIPLLLAMGALFYQSHQPGDSFTLPDISNIDKLLHCGAYAVLGGSFLFALTPQWKRRHPVLAGWAAILFCLLYGIFDEFHQSFIPGRFAGIDDVAADFAGGVLAVAGDWGWRRWQMITKARGGSRELSCSE